MWGINNVCFNNHAMWGINNVCFNMYYTCMVGGTIMEFEGFGKIPRLSREIIITEKLDGTNAQILIDNEGNIQAGSRNRYIVIGDDNHGFAKWVEDNKNELLKLGPGRHFGEWWGVGIQRGYGLSERRFSLFNTARWGDMFKAHLEGHETNFPTCCHVVPVLYRGVLDTQDIRNVMKDLKEFGSVAAEGFMDPEGIIIYHKHSNMLFKQTFDDEHKG